jgi:hypothetical protein
MRCSTVTIEKIILHSGKRLNRRGKSEVSISEKA